MFVSIKNSVGKFVAYAVYFDFQAETFAKVSGCLKLFFHKERRFFNRLFFHKTVLKQ